MIQNISLLIIREYKRIVFITSSVYLSPSPHYTILISLCTRNLTLLLLVFLVQSRQTGIHSVLRVNDV